MELKAELLSPYTQMEKTQFIITQNHRLGYEIREVEKTIETEEKIFEFETVEEKHPIYDENGEISDYEIVKIEKPVMTIDEETEEEVQKYHLETVEKIIPCLQAWGYTEEEIEKRREEEIGNLELTGADVERAIYEAKGMDFEDLVNFVIAQEIEGFDVKRLRIELKANHFVRKHPYVDMLGQLLGYTKDDMDFLFENKRFPEKEVIENDTTDSDRTDIIQDETVDE